MNIINRGRATGKTTMMVTTSYVMDIPIICRTEQNKEHILEVARKLGCEVNVYTANEWIQGHMGKSGNQVLIDEGESLMRECLEDRLNCKVAALTLTVPMDEEITECRA